MQTIVEINRRKRTINMVGYMMRYQKTFKLAKTMLQNNILGEVFSFWCDYVCISTF